MGKVPPIGITEYSSHRRSRRLMKLGARPSVLSNLSGYRELDLALREFEADIGSVTDAHQCQQRS